LLNFRHELIKQCFIGLGLHPLRLHIIRRQSRILPLRLPQEVVSEFVFSFLVLVLDLFVPVHHISLSLGCAFTQDNDLILSLGELPASEDKQVRSDGCTSMAEPRVGRLAHVLSTSPGHAVSRPDHEIITFIRSGVGLMLVTGSRSFGPSAEH